MIIAKVHRDVMQEKNELFDLKFHPWPARHLA